MTINEFIMKYREVDQRDYRGTELEYSYEDGVTVSYTHLTLPTNREV